MSTSFVLALIWLIVTNVKAMFPSKDKHWKFAYVMMAIGVPIFGFVIYENGIWAGLVLLLAAMWVMRWPVIYLGRWLRKMAGMKAGQ